MTGLELLLPHKRSILAFFMLTILITYLFFLIIRIRYTCFGHVACSRQEAFFKSVYCCGSGAPWWLGDTLHILHMENYCCRKVEKSHTMKNHNLVVGGLSFGITFCGSTPHFSGGWLILYPLFFSLYKCTPFYKCGIKQTQQDLFIGVCDYIPDSIVTMNK